MSMSARSAAPFFRFSPGGVRIPEVSAVIWGRGGPQEPSGPFGTLENLEMALRVGLHQVFRKTKRKTEGPQHFAFPEISRENRGCLVLHSSFWKLASFP